MKSVRRRFWRAFVLFILISQSVLKLPAVAGVKLDLAQEIQETESALKKASGPVKDRLKSYLSILKRMNESYLNNSSGINKHPGKISLRLKNRILKAMETGFGRQFPNDTYDFFDRMESKKKEWKEASLTEVSSGVDLQYELMHVGTTSTSVASINGHVFVDTEKLVHEESKGSFSSARIAYLYRSWEPAVLLKKHQDPEEDKSRWEGESKIQYTNKVAFAERRILQLLIQSFKENGAPPMGLPEVYGIAADGVLMKKYRGDGADLIDQPNFSRRAKLNFLLQAAQGLVWLHSHGFVHRDIKPENILYLGDLAVYADFDLAEVPQERITESPNQRDSGGTWDYVAPEIVAGSWGEGDRKTQIENAFKADVFSQSIAWTEIFYGSRILVENLGPLRGTWHQNTHKLVLKLIKQYPRDPLVTLLTRGMASRPSSRISSTEFLKEVYRIFEQENGAQ